MQTASLIARGIPHALLAAAAERVTDCIGLSFPPPRWSDLARGIQAIADDLHFTNAAECAAWIAHAPLEERLMSALARHMTVGETYFMREPASFDALRHDALPELIAARRAQGQLRLRLWSAGCASGEEAYSLAILLEMAVPDLRDWDVRIHATDVNPAALRIAALGRYRAWSFRNVPEAIQQRFFHPGPDGSLEIVPRIRDIVTFTPLNLAADDYPVPFNAEGGIDIVLCRNVLMYFDKARAQDVVRKFARTLGGSGYLVVGTTELAYAAAAPFAPHRSRHVPLFRSPAARSEAAPEDDLVPQDAVDSGVRSQSPPAAAKARASSGPARDSAPAQLLMARAYANRGALKDALQCVQRAIAADKTNPAAHYLHASILLELGSGHEVHAALNRATFLAPDFALAYYMRGTLAFREGNLKRAIRDMESTLAILAHHDPREVLPDTDGMTAGRLAEFANTVRHFSSSGVEA